MQIQHFLRDQQALFGKEQRTRGANMYGVHPTYTALEDEEGNAHTVLFLNSNAQAIKLKQRFI